MKKLLLLIFCGIICLFSCNSIDKQKVKAKKEALTSGVRIDSIMFGLSFGDSPDKVKQILNEFSSHCPGGFEFHFRYPKALNPYKWKVFTCWFYNDSLYDISIVADIPSYKWDECLACLDTLYSLKYGLPIRDKLRSEPAIDWYKGNLNIHIWTSKSDGKYLNDNIWICYKNMSMKLERPIYKTVFKEKYRYNLYYGKEYWDKTYKDAENILLNEELKDI